jgi:predicted esterase
MINPTSGLITITKTARYYTLGALTPATKEVWIVLHGYAQLAADFIALFDSIVSDDRFIIAPEGLNKFYAKGFGGKPAATWMTSEMREAEIKDYTHYLNTLAAYFALDKIPAKIVLFGFSQGVATASRWLHQTPLPIHRFVVYSGEIAAELQNPVSAALIKTPITYVTGTNDKLISAQKLEDVRLFMNSLNAQLITFDGGHEIKKEVLELLV